MNTTKNVAHKSSNLDFLNNPETLVLLKQTLASFIAFYLRKSTERSSVSVRKDIEEMEKNIGQILQSLKRKNQKLPSIDGSLKGLVIFLQDCRSLNAYPVKPVKKKG
ncbi:MAG: hypothetical protein ACOYOK_00095 [Pseudobdellovibrionaceae bacterium]